jgi:hypothetical protein
MNHYKYHVSDPADSRFEATGYLEGGELVLDIKTELESGERSIGLRALDQLRKILTHFTPRYESLRVCWTYGDNLKAFNNAAAAGATREEAVLRTMIGHQIALAGYADVSIRILEGLPARYTKVVASFRKS